MRQKIGRKQTADPTMMQMPGLMMLTRSISTMASVDWLDVGNGS